MMPNRSDDAFGGYWEQRNISRCSKQYRAFLASQGQKQKKKIETDDECRVLRRANDGVLARTGHHFSLHQDPDTTQKQTFKIQTWKKHRRKFQPRKQHTKREIPEVAPNQRKFKVVIICKEHSVVAQYYQKREISTALVAEFYLISHYQHNVSYQHCASY